MKIALSRGKYAIIDRHDITKISGYSWHAGKCDNIFYARAYIRGSSKTGVKYAYMHRIICNPPNGLEIDHINGNSLDNRKENLRAVTSSQNKMNKRSHNKSKSKYKGVSILKNKWRAEIKYDGAIKHIGVFDNEKIAAIAYDRVAKIHFGKFARLNFPSSNHLPNKSK